MFWYIFRQWLKEKVNDKPAWRELTLDLAVFLPERQKICTKMKDGSDPIRSMNSDNVSIMKSEDNLNNV